MNVIGKSPHRRVEAQIRAWASGVLAAGVIALALYFLLHRLGSLDRDEIVRALARLSAKALGECAALTGISFLALGAYDMVAVRIVAGRRVSLGRAWLAGSVANAISNTLGFHAFTGTAVRYRLLSRSGLSGPEVASVPALTWSALALGFVTMLSLAVAVSAQAAPWQKVCALISFGLLLISTKFLVGDRTLRVGASTLRLPSRKVALAQMGMGAIEMASAIGALFVLMPGHAGISFPAFSTLYIGAVLLGIASHAPGGIGVFEATMLAVVDRQDSSGVVAALLAYRLIYNVAPFLLASLVLAGDELRTIFSSKVGSA